MAVYTVAISSFQDVISLLKRLRLIKAPVRPDVRNTLDREIERYDQTLKAQSQAPGAAANLACQHSVAAQPRAAAATRPSEVRTARLALERALVEPASYAFDLAHIDEQIPREVALDSDATVTRISARDPTLSIYQVESQRNTKLIVEQAPDVTALQHLSAYGLRGNPAISPTAGFGTLTVLTESRTLGTRNDPGEGYVITSFNTILNAWNEFALLKEEGTSLTAVGQRSDTLSAVEAALSLQWVLGNRARLNVLMDIDQEEWGTASQLGVNLMLPGGEFLRIGWGQ